MASGHVSRIKRPNTWLHRPMLQNVKKALANLEPSTHGTNRTTRAGLMMSVDRGRPEVAGNGSRRRFYLMNIRRFQKNGTDDVNSGVSRPLV
jgi:hypothetical protein